MTQNINVMPSQAELRSVMPYQHQPNQTEGVNRARLDHSTSKDFLLIMPTFSSRCCNPYNIPNSR